MRQILRDTDRTDPEGYRRKFAQSMISQHKKDRRLLTWMCRT